MFRNYLKIAFRNLNAQRAYTLLNVVGLTIGMAGGLLIFLFIYHHLNTDRHHAKFDRIYRIVLDLHLDDGSIEHYPEAPLPMSKTLRTDYPQVDQAAFLRMNRSLTVSINRPGQTSPNRFLEQEGTAIVEAELFQIFDYQWLGGNPKTALREPNSVVLTESWAKRYFGDSDPMGQVMELDHKVNATVTGLVADPVRPTDTNIGLFISMPTIRQLDPEFDVHEWGQLSSTNRLYCTLKDNKPATARQIETTFPALSKKHFGDVAKAFHFHIQPLADIHFDVQRVGGVIRLSLLGSLGLIGLFLIVIACINFVNLATAQAFRRSKEVGIRKTLGSSRIQLARQFLLETSLIVVIATILAMLVVVVSLPLFSNRVHISLSLKPNGPMLLFIGLLMAIVVLLAGGYPAFVLSGFSPWASLRGKLMASSLGGYSLRKGLVVLQFVICQILLVGSLVVMKQMNFIRQTDLGFQKDNVLIVNLPNSGKETWQAFKNKLNQYPDIKAVTLQYRPPSAGVMNGGSFKFGSKTEWVTFPVRERLADADYLKAYNLQLVAGRNISEGDSIREYVINETLAHKLGFRNPQDIIGKPMQYYLSQVPLPIVGVVKDFHQKSLHEAIAPCFIASFPAMYRQAGIRISGQSSVQTLAHIRQVWQSLYPTDVFDYEFLNDQLAQFYETETTISQLVNTFALMAMVICGLGLYGLVAFTVGQRTKEIGIRKVLGASVASIVALLSKDFLKLVLTAIVLASPVAWWAMNQWLQDFAYKIDIAWWVFVLAGLLAIAIALLTVSFQSVKAALMNPVKSLRFD
ncbi:ABC transporter permease [Spirosoma endbachense]|uniref:FtsX-like permease family protein n=1 Tax=Spirosoma endbachense TaxID=2666025 RepID=A0A6P1VR47_9BACT|nr:ABC transporter permease [Spirosoma endbachense]QHV94460.1 FtsX-like permease family protein [Spirosoma endbachense]